MLYKTKYFCMAMFMCFISCRNTERELENETEKLKNEMKIATSQFIEENRIKLSDEELEKSIDSLTKLYIVDKSKKLAARYINTKKGIERINYIKQYVDKKELIIIFQAIPEQFENDTNYISLRQYIYKK